MVGWKNLFFTFSYLKIYCYFLQDFPNNLQMKIQTEKIFQNFIETTNF